MPSVWRRSAVGICTVIDISSSYARSFFGRGNYAGHFVHIERLPEVELELLQLRRNRPLGAIRAGEHIGGLQAVASDAEDRRFLGQDAILAIEFGGAANRDSAGCLGEDAFGLGQQFDGIDYFGV